LNNPRGGDLLSHSYLEKDICGSYESNFVEGVTGFELAVSTVARARPGGADFRQTGLY